MRLGARGLKVVSAAPVRLARSGWPSAFFAEPSAGALGDEHLGRAEPESKVAHPYFVLDRHVSP